MNLLPLKGCVFSTALVGLKSKTKLNGKVASSFHYNTLLYKDMKRDPHTSFHHFFISLYVSHDLKNPQMSHEKLKIWQNIENFAKIIKN